MSTDIEKARKAIALLESAIALELRPEPEDERLGTDAQWRRVVNAVADAGDELLGYEQQRTEAALARVAELEAEVARLRAALPAMSSSDQEKP